MDFETALGELAEKDTKTLEGEETDGLRDEFPDTVDVQLLRQLVYSLQSVSIGSQQLMYFAGSKYAQRIEMSPESFEEVFEITGELFEHLDLGRLEVDELDEEDSRVSLYESAFTYEGPEAGKPACFFVAGFLAGALKAYTGEKYVVNEITCCAQGNDHCEFRARRT